jgi:hypothetical protein
VARLHSPERRSAFSLDVDCYQLVKPVGEDFDDNWLVLRISVETPERRWNGHGPYLTTFEMNHLIARMKSWAAGGGVEVLKFTARNLAFGKGKGTADLVHLRVGFDLDCHPEPKGKPGKPHWVRFDITPAELREFAGDLEKSMSGYPERHLTRGSKIYKPKKKL